MSLLGDRKEQQDSYSFVMSENIHLALVCDGMGGHTGGRLASLTAAGCFVNEYKTRLSMGESIASALLEAIGCADRQVASLTNEDGSRMMAGSTLVCTVIDNGQLHWISAGDSRFYLMRDDKMIQVTKDHTYKILLDERLSQGIISREEYESSVQNGGERLISFMGVGGLPYIDSNSAPIALKSGDRLLLTSDGMYKVLPTEDIERIISNFNNVSEALRAIEMKIARVSQSRKIIRDNITVVLVKIK